MDNRRRHLGLYGSVSIPKGFCEQCQAYAFIIDNKYQCCDAYAPITNYRQYIRYSGGYSRRRPSEEYQSEQLYRQDRRCFYCGLKLDEPQWNFIRMEYSVFNIAWDHFVPYNFTLSNRDVNFVASCSLCNGIKGGRFFETVEEARTHVRKKREKKGYQNDENLSELFGTVLHEPEKENLLQRPLPVPIVGQTESTTKASRDSLNQKPLDAKLKLEEDRKSNVPRNRVRLTIRKSCQECGKEFSTVHHKQIYCTKSCGSRGWNKRNPYIPVSKRNLTNKEK